MREFQHNHESIEKNDFDDVSFTRNVEKNDVFYARVTATIQIDTHSNQLLTTFIDESTNQTSAEIFVFERELNSDSNLQSQNIYNVKKIVRKRKLNRYTSTQILLKTLHKRD